MCPSSPVTGFIKDGISGLMKVTASSIHSHTREAFGKDKKEFISKLFVLFSVHLSLPHPLFSRQISTLSMENSHFLSL